MYCKCAFKVYLDYDDDMDRTYSLIDEIGIEPGITENILYYGLRKVRVSTDSFNLIMLVNETLSGLFDKQELLLNLKTRYAIRYALDIRFSDVDEFDDIPSTILDTNTISFLKNIEAECYINGAYQEF